MNRRLFIKKTSFIAIFLVLIFNCLKVNAQANYSLAELTGRANIKLYGKDFKLQKEVAEAFSKLQEAAKKDGFSPYVISSYRSFNHQKSIWDRKYKKYIKSGLSPQKAIEKIILYSTIPGTSRHHWGTDLDIIDGKVGIVDNPLNEKHFNKGGVYHPFKLWLNENAHKFGFYEVYTNEKNRKGFAYEPWHFSYKPIACTMLSEYTLLDFQDLIKNLNILGKENFTPEMINKYLKNNLLDINPELLPF
ncbi:M15 family metallopeptidase [Weeksellaceae bacterium TAE3-ERU29]|nr:M15 family metallopeptidase [Weeksellaceae bacterium TAE3-ERU29]